MKSLIVILVFPCFLSLPATPASAGLGSFLNKHSPIRVHIRARHIPKPFRELAEEGEKATRKLNEVQKRTFKEAIRTINRFGEKVEEETGVTIGDGVVVTVEVPLGKDSSEKELPDILKPPKDSPVEPNEAQEAKREPANRLATLALMFVGAAVVEHYTAPEKITADGTKLVEADVAQLRSTIAELAEIRAKYKNNPNFERRGQIYEQREITKKAAESARIALKTTTILYSELQENSWLDRNGLIRYELKTKLSPKFARLGNQADRATEALEDAMFELQMKSIDDSSGPLPMQDDRLPNILP